MRLSVMTPAASCPCPYAPLFPAVLSHCVFLPLFSLRLPQFLPPVRYLSSTLYLCQTSFIHSSRTYHSLHPSPRCITHPPAQSSIHAFIQPSISSSIHAASPLFIYSLPSQLASTLHILVLSSLS